MTTILSSNNLKWSSHSLANKLSSILSFFGVDKLESPCFLLLHFCMPSSCKNYPQCKHVFFFPKLIKVVYQIEVFWDSENSHKKPFIVIHIKTTISLSFSISLFVCCYVSIQDMNTYKAEYLFHGRYLSIHVMYFVVVGLKTKL